MKAAQWKEVLFDLLSGNSAKYDEQHSFYKRCLPYIGLGSVAKVESDCRMYAKSFSYATQLYGPLKDTINLVTLFEGTAEALSTFLYNYYRYIGRTALVDSAPRLANQEIASWGAEVKHPILDEELVILTDFGYVFNSYQEIIGMAGIASRAPRGLILMSPSAMDLYPAAYSVNKGAYAGWENFDTTTILDVLDIYEETL